MNIRYKFYLIIATTFLFSATLSLGAFLAHKSLDQITLQINLLQRQRNAVTNFRAACRQTLLDLTELLYTRDPIKLGQIQEELVEAQNQLDILDRISPEEEKDILAKLKASFQRVAARTLALAHTTKKPYSKEEIYYQENISNLFKGELAPLIKQFADSLHEKVDSKIKDSNTETRSIAIRTPIAGTIFAFLIISLLTIYGQQLLREIGVLNASIKNYNTENHQPIDIPIEKESELKQVAEAFEGLTRQIFEFHTRLQQKQLEVVASSRLASLGEMSAGIAHEVNNPLAIIQGSVSLIPKLLGNPEKLNSKIASIERSCERIEKIVKGLKKYSRSSASSEKEVYDLEAIIKEVLILTQAKALRHSTKISFNGPGPTPILCNEIEIEQVFVNLVNNGIDAVKNEIERLVAIELKVTNGLVTASVTNSGPRIDRQVEAKLFTPFFTTKKVGEGTGLGLSICKGILDDHKAEIVVRQDLANTCFQIRFKPLEVNKNAA